MKKVLAVALNLQSSNRWRWPTASAQPSSSARGEERRWNFTCAFAAGTCSRLASSSSARVASGHQWRRKNQQNHRGGGTPLRAPHGGGLFPSRVGARSTHLLLVKQAPPPAGRSPPPCNRSGRCRAGGRVSSWLGTDGQRDGRTDGRRGSAGAGPFKGQRGAVLVARWGRPWRRRPGAPFLLVTPSLT